MTLSEHGGRLFVSVTAIVAHKLLSAREPESRCGIDLGIGHEWAVVAHADDTLAALDRRSANLRREAIHTLTTTLVRRYGTIVLEDLDVSSMARGMGRRAFRRTVHQAGIGSVRSILSSKTHWAGGRLVAADRWFASSKIHHGCGGYRAERVKDRNVQRGWSCRPGAVRG